MTGRVSSDGWMNDRKGKSLKDFQRVLTSQKTGKTGEIVRVKRAGAGGEQGSGDAAPQLERDGLTQVRPGAAQVRRQGAQVCGEAHSKRAAGFA